MTPLNWPLLTAFEAVARHRNFTRAAAELNVLQPAISRRVAALEAALGVPLLRRTRPQATLTREGETLYRALASGTRQIREALDLIRPAPDRAVVTVNTTIGFASCYLMQRLAAFRAANPEITVELVSRDQNHSYGVDQADIVIVFDHPKDLPGIRQARIFGETLVPVGRPDVVAGLGDSPRTLAQARLLHLGTEVHKNDWAIFFDGTGVAAPAPRSDQTFTSFMVCLQAALNGEGIMLGWEHLLQSHFDLGLLARVGNRRIPTDRGYFACLTARSAGHPRAERLWHWLAGLNRGDRGQSG